MAQKGILTKSPKSLAQQAYKIALEALPTYSSRRSRHDFTQAQLFAILTLKQFFQTDYRGVIQLLSDWPALQKVLKLTKLPHYTTVQKAHQRLLKKGLLSDSRLLFSSMQPELA
jgi:hypothetical protein